MPTKPVSCPGNPLPLRAMCRRGAWLAALVAWGGLGSAHAEGPPESVLAPSLAYIQSHDKLQLFADSVYEAAQVAVAGDRQSLVHSALGVRWRPGGTWRVTGRVHVASAVYDDGAAMGTAGTFGQPGLSVMRAWRFPALLAPNRWEPLFRTRGLIEAHLALGIDVIAPWNIHSAGEIDSASTRTRFGDQQVVSDDAWLMRVNFDYRHDVLLCRNIAWQLHAAPLAIGWNELAIEWAGSLGWQLVPGSVTVVAGYRGRSHVAGERFDRTLPAHGNHAFSIALDLGSSGRFRVFAFTRTDLDNLGAGVALNVPLARDKGKRTTR